MRRRTLLCLAAGLALTGCGGNEPNRSSAPELPETSAAESTEECVGYGCSPEQDAELNAAESEANAEPTGPERNDRGNIEKELGEEGGFTDLATGETTVTFAIDKITPNFACTGEFADPPERGHFVAIDLRMATAPAPTFDAELYFTVSSYDFKFIGSDGVTVGDLGTYATYGCLADGQEFTTDALAPSQKYMGKIVLDVPEASGTLMYLPSATGGTSGWEWEF